MAFSSTSRFLGSTMVNRLKGSGCTFVTSTTPRMKAYAPTVDHLVQKPKGMKGDWVPVYVALGLITVSAGLGLYTAKQQLMHSPGVRVKKSKRETLPEVVDPDEVVEEADNFIKKSFFRKVAHVQEFNNDETRTMPDPIHGDVLTRSPRVETLKSVGVDPKAQ